MVRLDGREGLLHDAGGEEERPVRQVRQREPAAIAPPARAPALKTTRKQGSPR